MSLKVREFLCVFVRAATVSQNLTIRTTGSVELTRIRQSSIRRMTKIATRICPGAKINEKLAPRRLTVAKGKALDFCVDLASPFRLDQHRSRQWLKRKKYWIV